MGRAIRNSWVAMDDLPPVLVAEDEALIRAALVEALQDGGYSVLEAESGSAAIEQ